MNLDNIMTFTGIVGIVVWTVVANKNSNGCGAGFGAGIATWIGGGLLISAIVEFPIFFAVMGGIAAAVAIICYAAKEAEKARKTREEDEECEAEKALKQRQENAKKYKRWYETAENKVRDIKKNAENVTLNPEYKSVDLQGRVWEVIGDVSLNVIKLENTVAEINAKGGE